MKWLNRLMALMATIAVTVFIVFLVLLVSSDGDHDWAGKSCFFSLVTAFVALVIYHPKTGEEKLD